MLVYVCVYREGRRAQLLTIGTLDYGCMAVHYTFHLFCKFKLFQDKNLEEKYSISLCPYSKAITSSMKPAAWPQSEGTAPSSILPEPMVLPVTSWSPSCPGVPQSLSLGCEHLELSDCRESGEGEGEKQDLP